MRTGVITLIAALLMFGAVGFRVADADEPVSSSVRYNREIVRIFDRKCVSCHTNAGLAMPLERYHDVRPWARAIREEILERRMPPWPAAAGVRPLANELALTTREISIITAWIDGGTPRGEPSDLPPPRSQEPWKNGKPDLTLTLPAQQVKLDGSPSARRVNVATGLQRERWLRGFDILAGERRALRSAFLYLQTRAGQRTWIGGWTPWYAMRQPPENVGFRVPAGSTLEVEMHYAGWQDDEGVGTDATTLGLYFQVEAPAIEAETVTVTASTAGGALRGETAITDETVIWAVKPRLDRDNRAESGALEMRAVMPGGRVEPILWIKDQQPDWQLPYVLREPLHLPPGSRLILTAHAENIGGVNAAAAVLTYRTRPGPTAVAPNTLKGRAAPSRPQP